MGFFYGPEHRENHGILPAYHFRRFLRALEEIVSGALLAIGHLSQIVSRTILWAARHMPWLLIAVGLGGALFFIFRR